MPAARQPQDHKPKVQSRTKTERETEPFTWTHGDDTIELPDASKIKAGVIRRASKQPGEIQQIFAIFEEIVDEATLTVMDDMDLDELGDMFMAWQRHGGADMGES